MRTVKSLSGVRGFSKKLVMGWTVLLLVVLVGLSGCGGGGGDDSPTTPAAVSGTLHVILAISDHESDIGPGCTADRNSIKNWLNTISQATGLTLNLIELTGTGGNLHKSDLTNAINNLSIGTNDVVLYYYSGHGGSDGDRGAELSRWPIMVYMNQEDVRFEEIQQSLRAKGARLTLAIADCCNNYPDQAKLSPYAPRGSASDYRTLFLQYRGYILLSAASHGQFSIGDNDLGGLFTLQFLQAVDANGGDWNTIISSATRLVTSEGITPYQPQSEVQIGIL